MKIFIFSNNHLSNIIYSYNLDYIEQKDYKDLLDAKYDEIEILFPINTYESKFIHDNKDILQPFKIKWDT